MMSSLIESAKQQIKLNGFADPSSEMLKVDSSFDERRRSSHQLFIPEEFIKINSNDLTSQIDGEDKPEIEDVIFEMFEKDDHINVNKFMAALTDTGIRATDPRLANTNLNFKLVKDKKRRLSELFETLLLNRDEFKRSIKQDIILISRALRKHFVIPEFKTFAEQVDECFRKCKPINSGKVADYIPQLAKYKPEYWGVSLCTVDGQRHSIGDTQVPFTIQSSGKPINYAIALAELGPEKVHEYVGQESSGRMFNELLLDHDGKPHNPMVNAGAIIICSLIKEMVKPEMRNSEKFDWIINYFKSMAGGDSVGFNNATFLSEREAADRNYAIAYFMKENKCFPKTVSHLKEVTDFYFQLCALEVNCESVSVMAATLANGGICPITGEAVLPNDAVRDVLSLMYSCGMYNYSGQFAFRIGLPAKSGVCGCIMVVVPNVLGFCCWSPPLDKYGNSVRGLKFCEEIVTKFNFHHYDNLRYSPSDKTDPRRQRHETEGMKIVNLLFSAASGDVTSIRRHYLSGLDMNLRDYDGRTALHLAAAEGHRECVEFLLRICQVDFNVTDRWGNTPLDDAIRFGHDQVFEILKDWTENQQIYDVKNLTLN